LKIFIESTNISFLDSFSSKKRWFFDKEAVIVQMNKWQEKLPWIKPYYAMKANPSEELLETLTSSEYIGLDAASLNETLLASYYVENSSIIYTNPHIIPREKNEIINLGIHLKVVDNINELHKMIEYGLTCPILIRLKSNMYLANVTFDSKFGCSQSEAFSIMDFAKENKIQVKGISFHIGSGGDFDRKFAYQTAIEYSKPILEKIENPILDIGGGLMYDTDLDAALGWTKDLPYQMISEPGRYFAQTAYHLAVQIIEKTSRGVFLDNGVYHELNVYHRDHWEFPKLTHVYDNNSKKIEAIKDYETINLFGPTCDSYDILPNVAFPKYVKPGDWILLRNMGAYTSSASVNFNGISAASTSGF
jgi:ornithine decarboxylase